MVLTAALALAGCGITREQAADIAVASTQVAAVKQQWSEVERIYADSRDAIPSDSRSDTDPAMEQLSGIVASVDSDDPNALLDNIDRARELYDRARGAYQTLRPVAADLIASGDIQGDEAAQLRRIDERIRDLDERLRDINEATSEDTLQVLGVVRDIVPVLGRIVLEAAS
jgi:acetyl-CoA acetyltransferase